MTAEARGDVNSYLSLGDSISIDLYPSLDLQERGQLDTVPSGLDAASLFYENDDAVWPGCSRKGPSPRCDFLPSISSRRYFATV